MTAAMVLLTALVATVGDATSCELAFVTRDSGGASCMACHDGSAGPALGHGDSNRMVGRSYTSAWLASRGALRTLQFGSPIALHEGRVTCLSCHDPASRIPKHVAARNVCVECHAK